jgi:hypothetical protein
MPTKFMVFVPVLFLSAIIFAGCSAQNHKAETVQTIADVNIPQSITVPKPVPVTSSYIIILGTVICSFGVAASINGSLWSKIIAGGLSLMGITLVVTQYGRFLSLVLGIMAVAAFGLWLYNHHIRTTKIKE